MKRNLIFTIAVLSLISCDKRQEISGPERITEEFFESYRVRGPKASLNILLPTNKYISKQNADTVASQLDRLVRTLGDFQGHEKIVESSYGTGIVQLTYLVKYARQPLRFNFLFYHPGTEWRIQNFSFESEFLDEMDETKRPVRLKENDND